MNKILLSLFTVGGLLASSGLVLIPNPIMAEEMNVPSRAKDPAGGGAGAVLAQSKGLPRVSVADFGAIPDDGQNDAGSLRQAMEHCRKHPGTVLYFPPGVYDFRDEQAVKLMDDILAGVIKDAHRAIFQPYFPYVKGLDFNGVKDLTVEAAGAILLCDGWMEPVSLNHCRRITVKGLTIDYKRKPNSVGKIIEVQPEWFEASFDRLYPLTAQKPHRLMTWDNHAHRMLYSEAYSPKVEITALQTLRIFKKLPPEMKGNSVMLAHTAHFRPAILLLEASNIVLEDVTIHAQPGMGIVGHRSQDIVLRGLRVVPNAGRLMSTNTDATHFTSCTGTITYENCQFEGHGDDAVNIHNYYYTIQKPADGAGYDLVLKKADWHAQVLDYPDVGDTLELVDASTLAVVKTFTVQTRESNIPELRSRVTLNEALPAEVEKYYLINATRLPKVRITGCTVTSNRARGFLIKTRDVVIERCLIRETTGTGIHVGAEASWHEGPASANITIRYNRIIRCGGGAGTVGASGISVNVSAPDETVAGLHKNILIEGNIIEGEQAEHGIFVSGAEDVTIRYNEIAGCATPVKIIHSTKVSVYANPGVADFKAEIIR